MNAALDGKVVLLTGASGGIGIAIAASFAAAGASVIATDLTQAGAEQAAGAALAVGLDVTDPAGCEATIATIRDRYGRLDVVVNNAAAPPDRADVTELDLVRWNRILGVTLTGAFNVSRSAIPLMAASGGGSIIHVASQLGRVGVSRNPAYCAAKAGLINLARAMAIDHAPQGIRVNALSPGPIATGRIYGQYPTREEAEAAMGPTSPIGRLGRAEEIAAAALFLASDASSLMTGSDLLVDGGFTAW